MTFPKHEPSAPRKGKKPQPAVESPKPAKAKERTGGAAEYGNYYWCVKTELSDDGEIYVFADEVRYLPTGGVLFVAQRADGREQINLALAFGNWSAIFAASCFDGHAVAV
jgi:hypothetical protein